MLPQGVVGPCVWHLSFDTCIVRIPYLSLWREGAILLGMGIRGHGCDIFGNIIGNVTIFEYMSAI